MSMSCLEFRRRVGAEPHTRDPLVLAHGQECAACAAFAREQLALERRLERALRVPVPAELPARTLWRQGLVRRRTHRWMALAASVLLAAGLGLGVVAQFDRLRPLPGAVIAHIEHEPDLLMPPFSPAEPVRVSAVLQRGGAAATLPLENVVHAGLCPFRGRRVPHLVMILDGEPVSVLLLPHERTQAPRPINEQGYQGVILPHETGSISGSIVIVAPREDLLQPVSEQLLYRVKWTI